MYAVRVPWRVLTRLDRPRLVHDAHTAALKLIENPVMRNGLANHAEGVQTLAGHTKLGAQASQALGA